LVALEHKEAPPHHLAPSYKSRRHLSSREHRVVACPPLAALGELIVPPTPMAVWARLNLLLTHTELTRLRVGLTELPARRSPSSHDRRRAAIAELVPPPVLQARGPT
jgi:hypothetical protein